MPSASLSMARSPSRTSRLSSATTTRSGPSTSRVHDPDRRHVRPSCPAGSAHRSTVVPAPQSAGSRAARLSEVTVRHRVLGALVAALAAAAAAVVILALGHRGDPHVSVGFIVLSTVAGLAFAAVGALLVAERPGNAAGADPAHRGRCPGRRVRAARARRGLGRYDVDVRHPGRAHRRVGQSRHRPAVLPGLDRAGPAAVPGRPSGVTAVAPRGRARGRPDRRTHRAARPGARPAGGGELRAGAALGRCPAAERARRGGCDRRAAARRVAARDGRRRRLAGPPVPSVRGGRAATAQAAGRRGCARRAGAGHARVYPVCTLPESSCWSRPSRSCSPSPWWSGRCATGSGISTRSWSTRWSTAVWRCSWPRGTWRSLPSGRPSGVPRCPTSGRPWSPPSPSPCCSARPGAPSSTPRGAWSTAVAPRRTSCSPRCRTGWPTRPRPATSCRRWPPP